MKIVKSLPSGWTREKLGSLCYKITDGTHKTPDYKNEGVVFISAKNIRNGTLDFSDHKYISQEEHEMLTKRCRPETGDVMLSKSGSLGDSVVIPRLDFEFSIFESLALFKVNRSKIDPEYLMQILNSPLAKRYFWSITTGLAVKHLHLGDLKKMPIVCPKLSEQNSTNKTLGIWDEASNKISLLLKAKEKRLNALYQKFFREGSAINEHWDFQKIGKFVTPRNEKSVPSHDQPLFSLTIENGVTEKTDRYNREFLVKDTGAKTYKVVHPGDIVFNPANLRWGAIARSAIDHNVVLSPIYEVLQINENEIDPGFLTHALTCPRQIAIYATKTEGTLIERMAVKLDAFLLLKIRVPSDLSLQKEISDTLSSAQQEIELLKQLADKYKAQKRGLMQKLLTGQWRIKPDVVNQYKEA
jgi:type I restriction enzyme S subunit